MLDWVDGRPAAELSVRDRGLAYGDGLFETLAVRAGTPRLWSATWRAWKRGVDASRSSRRRVPAHHESQARRHRPVRDHARTLGGNGSTNPT